MARLMLRKAVRTAARSPITIGTDATSAEWDAYVERHPDGTGNHLWAWRGIYERVFGHETIYLAARDRSGSIAGVLPIVKFRHRLFGHFLVSLPFVNHGGVLSSDESASRALVDSALALALRDGASHLELRHTAQCFPDLAARRHKVSMKAPLEPNAVVAWERLDRKVRNQIRKAEKSGLRVDDGGAELIPDFYSVFARNMRDLGTPVYPRAWFEETVATFPDRARVFVVRHQGRPIAGAITFNHRDSVEIPSASSLRDCRAMCPNMILYWRIMQRAIAEGFRVLDFGRSTPGEGTYHFKTQWGAEAGPMCWEYGLVASEDVPDRSPSNRRFQAAIAVWRHLPVVLATCLGPQISRYLP